MKDADCVEMNQESIIRFYGHFCTQNGHPLIPKTQPYGRLSSLLTFRIESFYLMCLLGKIICFLPGIHSSPLYVEDSLKNNS